MKKLAAVVAALLLAGSSFAENISGTIGHSYANGTVIKVTPPKFRNEITVFNESGQEVIVYLNILHDGNDKVYKSETARVEPYAKWSLDFDYDDEWHDLVRDVKKKLKTKESDASAYEFDFHFKNDGMFLDKMRVVDGDLEIHVKSKGFDF